MFGLIAGLLCFIFSLILHSLLFAFLSIIICVVFSILAIYFGGSVKFLRDAKKNFSLSKVEGCGAKQMAERAKKRVRDWLFGGCMWIFGAKEPKDMWFLVGMLGIAVIVFGVCMLKIENLNNGNIWGGMITLWAGLLLFLLGSWKYNNHIDSSTSSSLQDSLREKEQRE
jgi:hypothetical protein